MLSVTITQENIREIVPNVNCICSVHPALGRGDMENIQASSDLNVVSLYSLQNDM